MSYGMCDVRGRYDSECCDGVGERDMLVVDVDAHQLELPISLHKVDQSISIITAETSTLHLCDF